MEWISTNIGVDLISINVIVIIEVTPLNSLISEHAMLVCDYRVQDMILGFVI